MSEFKGGTAVLTGGASGFGLECARIAAREGMNVVLVDVQQDALDKAQAEISELAKASGSKAGVMAKRVDVSKADQMEALAAEVKKQFGAPTFVFNNAGVVGGGFVWENSPRDWEWILGVNVWGVIHGVRLFTPMMLEAAKADPNYRGHVVNTASMAGLVSPPNMGSYSLTKHAVVTLSEAMFHELSLITEQVHAHVLCPFYVPTGISKGERNRPEDMANKAPPTRSQQVAAAMADKAVSSGKVTAAEVAQMTFDAMRDNRFYIFSHPQALGGVQLRMEDILQQRNPSDPFAAKPGMREQLKEMLREA